MRIMVRGDGFISDKLAREIEEHGDEVAGPIPDAHEPVHHVAEAEAAIEDIRAGASDIFDVADLLKNRETPFLFLTGYGSAPRPERFRGKHLSLKSIDGLPFLSAPHLRRRAVPAEVNPDDMVVELLAHARLKMPDPGSAERVVEAAMLSAIRDVERGRAMTDIGDLLMKKLIQELRQRRRRHLQ